MKVTVFSTKSYDECFLTKANGELPDDARFEFDFAEPHLNVQTAVLADGAEAICAFVNDDLSKPVLERLHELGVRFIALRCAGFNNVDLSAARDLDIKVARVPAYSPHAVAEHAVALLLGLNRRIFRAYNRVREGNFSLEGLLGVDLHPRTVGVVGTGRIGECFVRIMKGFGCRVLAYDLYPSDACRKLGVTYVELEDLLAQSDIISLHCPLTPETYHLIDRQAIESMKKGVMLINTSRGALVSAHALIEGLKSGHIGGVGLDVYEEEADLFFEDLSGQVIQDDTFARLLTFPNVLITGHQAFFTEEALEAIAGTTITNLRCFASGSKCENLVDPEKHVK